MFAWCRVSAVQEYQTEINRNVIRLESIQNDCVCPRARYRKICWSGSEIALIEEIFQMATRSPLNEMSHVRDAFEWFRPGQSSDLLDNHVTRSACSVFVVHRLRLSSPRFCVDSDLSGKTIVWCSKRVAEAAESWETWNMCWVAEISNMREKIWNLIKIWNM